MGWRWGSDSVFGVEWRRAARGRALYAWRAVAVALAFGLLAALVLSVPTALRVRFWPKIMRFAYDVVMVVEMVLAFGLAPATTAGAVCEERRRGRLEDLLVTALDAREIVLGKLAAGLAGLAMVVAALVPELLITAFLGGVEPGEVVAGSFVVLAVAAVGSSLALLFSIRARRSVEAMAAAATTVFALSLVATAWRTYIGTPPLWIRATDPWALVLDPALKGFSDEWLVFIAVSLAGAAGLTAVAGWRLRPDAMKWRDPGGGLAGVETRRASVYPPIALIIERLRDRFDVSIGRRLGMPEPTLDAAPVLWRAWRREGSAWMSGAWLAYTLAAIGAVVVSIAHGRAAMVNGYLVSAGVLLVGVSAATAWDDERGRGGFVPLLTTPLASREIVRGTWWGAYRVVPRLAVLPTLVVLLRGLFWGQPLVAVPMAAAAGALVLAYGAVATGIGLLIGLREPRSGRAISWTLALLLLANDAWPWFWSQVVGIHLIGADRPVYVLLAWVSPRMGSYLTTAWVSFLKREPGLYPYLAAVPVWATLLAAIGWALRRSIERNFDRLTGRMPAGSDADPRLATDQSPSDVAAPTGEGTLRFDAKA